MCVLYPVEHALLAGVGDICVYLKVYIEPEYGAATVVRIVIPQQEGPELWSLYVLTKNTSLLLQSVDVQLGL